MALLMTCKALMNPLKLHKQNLQEQRKRHRQTNRQIERQRENQNIQFFSLKIQLVQNYRQQENKKYIYLQ